MKAGLIALILSMSIASSAASFADWQIRQYKWKHSDFMMGYFGDDSANKEETKWEIKEKLK